MIPLARIPVGESNGGGVLRRSYLTAPVRADPDSATACSREEIGDGLESLDAEA
ncbi:hypothetical protein [Streptosporangium sp. OZ121]|uniref:hypothetical protein n=1 Tax=Streptosporangium sp. OZ121 TaxID=3444183 RepID=UPI003F79F6DF